jgi:hypothetical protein
MEALVILLAELLWAPLIAALIFFVNFALLIISLLLELCFWLFTRNVPGNGAARRRGRYRFLRSMRISALTGIVLMAAALLAVNFIFLDRAARGVLAEVGRRTHTELDFKAVSGNIFTGSFAFAGLTAKRQSETKSSFDLHAQRLTADLDLWTLFVRPISFESVTVDHVTGAIRRPERRKKEDGAAEDKLKPKRKFLIRDLTLTNVDIALSKGAIAPVSVALSSVKAAHFRSNFAIFDTLFRSDLAGRVDGHDISVVTEPAGIGRLTRWQMPDLPADTLNRIVTRPPVGWLRDGTLNVSVDDSWQLNAADDIHMDWQVKMQGVRAQAGQDAGIIEKALALPVAGYINRKSGNLDLRFTLVVNEKQFENMSSIDASVLWAVMSRSMRKAMGLSTGAEEEGKPKSGIGRAIEGVKRFFGRKREPANTD